MNNKLLTGNLVRLVASDPDKVGEMFSRWSRDSEFLQLLGSHTVQPSDAGRLQNRIRQETEKDEPGSFSFLIQRLQDERIIGETALESAFDAHGNAWLSIAIGERELWGQGFGSDAVQVALRFAFQELNLHRVSLSTFEYNPRAVRAYEKIGFAHEGRVRAGMSRHGKRWDVLYMGILRDEWQARQM